MSLLSTTAGVAVLDTRSRPGTITLPRTNEIVNRYIQFKDLYGAFGRSSLTISTQGGEAFDDGTTSKVFSDPFTFLTLYAASTTRWAQLGGTQTIQQTVSSLVVSSLTIGTGYGWLQLPPVQTVAVSTNLINADTITTNSTTSMYISAQILYVSSIMGAVVGAGNIATSNITSTVAGLGTAGFVSTASLQSTVSGLGTSGFVSTASLQSTVSGLGSFGYLSSVNSRFISTGNVSLSSLTLIDGNTGVLNSLFVSSGFLRFNTSTLNAIYPSNYVCQGRLTADENINSNADTVLPFVSDFDPQGWLANAGTSTARFQPTIAGYYIVSYQVWWATGSGVNQNNIQIRKGANSIAISQQAIPTAIGLSMNTTKLTYLNGTTDYLEFSVFTGTSGTTQTVQYGGTPNGVGTWFSASLITGGAGGGGGGGGGTGDVTSANLVSTVQGLGSASYVSSLSLNSTVRGLGSASYISSLSLNSTIQGLGTYGYLSSVSGGTGFVSSLTVNALTLGTGSGWLQLPPLQTVYSSTIFTQAQALYTLSSFFGGTSTLTTLDFYGLFGNYNNTVLAEISTGGGSQEFLIFKGSSASDRVRVQTTGTFVVETGVSARLWSDSTVPTLSNTTPAFIINTSSNVGIQTASPGATLDVAGTGRFQTVSTLNINLSTINGQVFGGPINSTTIGLATIGYISTSQLTSTVQGLGSSRYLSTIPVLASTSALLTSSISTGVLTTSSLQVNSLTIGTGTGWVNLGPLQTVAISSLQDNTGSLYATTVNVGSISTVNTLQYAGLSNNYNNTVLAEISTGAGIQELLVFKGSNASDRIRMQTTGTFVVETGVSTRLFNSNTTQTLSNVVPAFAINTSSNVGIQLAPGAIGATLDVGGVSRAITLSSQQANVSSLVSLNFSSLQGSVSSLTVNSLQFGDGTGWVSMGPIQATSLSTIQGNANINTTITTSTLALFVSSINGTVYTPGGGGGGGSAGPVPFISAFTVSTSYVQVSTISSYAIYTYGVIGTQFFNTSEEPMNLTSITDQNLTAATSTIINANALYASSSNDIRLTANSEVYIDAPRVITSSLLIYDTISTNSLVIYGQSTLTVQGSAFFQSLLSSKTVLTGALGIFDSTTGEPGYIDYNNGSFDLNGASILDQSILTSTIIGLGTLGYISSGGGGPVGPTVSSLQVQTSSIQTGFVVFNDISIPGGTTNLFVSSSYLYAGGNVLTGATARQVVTQTISF